MKEPKDRLKESRIRAGYETPTDAARALSQINQNTIISHENGNRPISKKTAQKYADVFGVAAGWILFGDNAKLSPSGYKIPLKGMVGAGQAVIMLSDDDIEYVDAPPNAKEEMIAVEVRGESMFPAFEDGTLLYYSTNRSPQDLVNKRCVVKLDDGRTLVKVLRPGSGSDLWTLQSINSQYQDIVDVRVEWASPIEWIKPKG